MSQADVKVKKVKRIAAIIYVLVMGFITAGTYLSQQQKAQVVSPDQPENLR